MAEAELERIILDAAKTVDGKKKLACSEAFRIAKEHSIPIAEIGRICEAENIRIRQCQLGCFQ